ncbi:DUF1178 family protein [Pelagibacterales bacterium SAG-MED15]|nr:DUF1178 family protein [Pelagibacterales bacterium SAG-MED15]
MIKYSLICEDCENTFDSWFSSSKEFDKLKKLKLVNCNSCNSLKVKKSLMSPQILKKQHNNDKKIKIFKNKMREYQKFIKKNFKYVGENFTYEARSLHYDPKNKSKGIYGKATDQEIKSLNEEGIEIQSIPWLNEKDN